MTWLATLAGAVLVAGALRDLFHTLWHPGGFGSLAQATFRAAWRTARILPASPSALVGPLALLAVVLLWTGMVVAGSALLYLPHMPGDFGFGSSVDPAASSDLVDALYLSVVTLATLGFGDIVPATAAMRVLVPVEGLVGFLLLTAAISWILQVYPALIRRRALAKRLALMQAAGAAEVARTGAPEVAGRLLDALADALVGVQVDLLQYAETYYFGEHDRGLSLAATLPYALELADAGEGSAAAEVRFEARLLRSAVDDLAAALDHSYLRTGASTERVLDAYAADHGH